MFLSQIVGRTAYEPEGHALGKVRDIVVSPGERMPALSAILVRMGNQTLAIPASEVASYVPNVVLSVPFNQTSRYELKPDDLHLAKDLLDKQLVDIHDYRVVRVNDIRLAMSSRGVRVVGVDVGLRGLLRRIGLEPLANLLQKIIRRRLPGQIISWEDVEPFERVGGRIRLKVPTERLAKLHPADIGRIINEMDPDERREVVQALDIETAAEALQEMHPEVQVDILQHLEHDRATDLLEEMEPDEAADLLGDLPSELSNDLLSKMELDDAEEVRELLAYDDESAGGLMTNEFIAIAQDLTAEQTLQRLRELAPEAETIYYVYIVDEDERLVGVLSLRDLIVAQPETPISACMVSDIISVHVDAGIEEIATLLGRYNLLAVPVVDDEYRLQGIITVDDALEQLLPEDWRRGARADRR